MREWEIFRREKEISVCVCVCVCVCYIERERLKSERESTCEFLSERIRVEGVGEKKVVACVSINDRYWVEREREKEREGEGVR